MRFTCAAFKLAGFVLWSALIVPLQILLLLVYKGKAAYVLPRLWHRGVCILFGIRYEMSGLPSFNQQALFVSNHISYLDIPLLGGVIKDASFLAKSEVKTWPVFGFLANLQQTAYIERKAHSVKKETEALQTRVKKKQSLIIFPEGTSSDGLEVLPFKSSLFTLAIDQNLVIQPVTISLLSANNHVPQTLTERRLYTWPLVDDIELPAHLWRFAMTKGAVLRLTFHAVINPLEYEDRKTLAKACRDSVSKGLAI